MAADDDGWYWCVHHGRVEQGATGCPPGERMGPYPTEAAARDWRRQVEARNDAWDADDRAWSGEDD